MPSVTSKTLKAHFALNVLRKHPAFGLQTMPRVHNTLCRWAARGLSRAGTDQAIPAHAAQLTLSADHGASRAQWQEFLGALHPPVLASPATYGNPLIVASPGAVSPHTMAERSGPTGLELTRHFDITFRSYAADDLRGLVADVPDTAWILFCAPDDRVLWSQVDYLADSRFDAATLVLPDHAFATGEQLFPHLMPGINALYALNCPAMIQRVFLRAGTLRKSLKGGTRALSDIVIQLLGQESAAGSSKELQCLGRPIVEIPCEEVRPFDAHRNALLSADHFLLPTDQGPMRSTCVHAADLGGVSVVICTKDKPFFISQLVARLLAYPVEILKDVIVVSNNTTTAHATHVLEQIAKEARVKVITYNEAFNFSAQCNLGARHSTGALLLFLNDDIVPISERWLEDLMVPFADPAMSATGSLLLYPDETIQHAGMVLGARIGAGHVLRQHKLPDAEFGFMASAPRYVSCLTGAVMLVRASAFWNVGGFDEKLAWRMQDVDLCMKLSAARGHLALIPRSTLFHMESLSAREAEKRDLLSPQIDNERRIFFERWGDEAYQDKFHPVLAAKSDLSYRTLAVWRDQPVGSG